MKTVGSSFFDNLSKPSPVAKGARIRLVSMQNDPDPVAPGSEGTVISGNGSQLLVDWDSGRTLSLIVDEDRWVVLDG